MKSHVEEVTALEREFEPMTAGPPAKSSVSPEPTYPVSQASGQGLTVGWNDLPAEMEEHILCNMHLPELARVSATCRAFHAYFQRRLAEQEEALSEVAIRCFGRKRVICIAGLIDRFLQGEPVDSNLRQRRGNVCWISADGLLEVEEPSCSGIMSRQRDGATQIVMRPSSHLEVNVLVPNRSWVDIYFWRDNRVSIFVKACGHEDVESMAFVQALLTWGLAPTFRNPHPQVNIRLDGGPGYRPTELLTQILPLLGLASRHKWRIRARGPQLGLIFE